MTTASLLDLNVLLTPINKKNPVGKDLRLDTATLYHQAKDARTAARAIERQQTQGSEKSAKANWYSVYELTVAALTEQSKDLEIAVWLTEALLREHGFAGLAQGFQLLHGLVTQYWEQLYPVPDEDGWLSRVAPLTGLNGAEIDGSLITPIALTPLITSNNQDSFALWQYHQATELLKIADPEKRSQRITSGWTTLEILESVVADTDITQMQKQCVIITECLTHYRALITLFEQHCGDEAPPSSRIIKKLNECLECLTGLAKPHLPAVTEQPVQPITSASNTQATIAVSTAYSENITRDQVLENILAAAHFFHKTEPHSPIPYLLERAVRWGKMPLPALFKELVSNEVAKAKLEDLTGVTLP